MGPRAIQTLRFGYTKTKIVTDHANLQWLTSVKPQQSKLARWCLSMSEFDFYIEHKPGKKHVVPDTLSRLPVTHEGSNFVIMPPDTSNFLDISFSLDVPYITRLHWYKNNFSHHCVF